MANFPIALRFNNASCISNKTLIAVVGTKEPFSKIDTIKPCSKKNNAKYGPISEFARHARRQCAAVGWNDPTA
jgi:hypothetical protein